MVSFVSYVLQFKNSDTALGDVARDMMLDTGIKRSWGYMRLLKHMNEMNACERVYNLLETAYNHYRTME
jgi:hypothetical protein